MEPVSCSLSVVAVCCLSNRKRSKLKTLILKACSSIAEEVHTSVGKMLSGIKTLSSCGYNCNLAKHLTLAVTSSAI